MPRARSHNNKFNFQLNNNNRIKALVQLFDQVDFAHIFREHNEDADMLSKRGIGCPEGVLNIEESMGDNLSRYTHRLY